MTKNQLIYALFANLRASALCAEELSVIMIQEHYKECKSKFMNDFQIDESLVRLKDKSGIFEVAETLNNALDDLIKIDAPIVTEYLDIYHPWVKEFIKKSNYFHEKNIKL